MDSGDVPAFPNNGKCFPTLQLPIMPEQLPVWYAFVFSSDPNSPLSWSHELFNSNGHSWPSVTQVKVMYLLLGTLDPSLHSCCTKTMVSSVKIIIESQDWKGPLLIHHSSPSLASCSQQMFIPLKITGYRGYIFTRQSFSLLFIVRKFSVLFLDTM